jgi:hypothetical protein
MPRPKPKPAGVSGDERGVARPWGAVVAARGDQVGPPEGTRPKPRRPVEGPGPYVLECGEECDEDRERNSAERELSGMEVGRGRRFLGDGLGDVARLAGAEERRADPV